MSSSYLYGCEWCGGPPNGGNCPGCSIVESGNGFVYDQNPDFYNETTDFFHQPPHQEMETYSCESYGNDPYQGFDCQTGNTLVYEQVPCNNQNFGYDQHRYDLQSHSQQFFCCEFCGGPHQSFDCQTGNMLFNEHASCNNQNFGYDQYPQDSPQQYDCCEYCGGPHNSSDCQTRNPLVYEHVPCNNYDYTYIDQPSQYTTPQPLPQSELTRAELINKIILNQIQFNMNIIQFNMNFQIELDHIKEQIEKQNPSVNSFYLEESDEDNRENTMDEVHNYSSQSTAQVLSQPQAYPPSLPRFVVVGDEKLDIDLPFGEQIDTLSMGDREIDFKPSDIESLPANDPVPIPRMSDEPLSNSNSMSRSFDVTISNPLFDFDDDFALRIDNKIFDDEFEDLCSLDPP
jgi:hypothetical protein